MRKVMIFGVFDGIHEGHRYFLREAKNLGGYLIAVVTQDHLIQELKKKSSNADLAKRIRELEKENIADEIVAGDDELGAWEVLRQCHPEIIALGYDQQALKENLEAHLDRFAPRPELVVIGMLEPKNYRNSLS